METAVLEQNNDNNKKKIFIPAIGSLGDVKPYLVLAKELKNRGHTVWLGVHKRFEDQIKADGKYYLLKIQSNKLAFVYILQVLIQLKLMVIWK
jgi:UDP:flavonoid glycosyltransferase YjiC (YdhE family)